MELASGSASSQRHSSGWCGLEGDTRKVHVTWFLGSELEDEQSSESTREGWVFRLSTREGHGVLPYLSFLLGGVSGLGKRKIDEILFSLWMKRE